MSQKEYRDVARLVKDGGKFAWTCKIFGLVFQGLKHLVCGGLRWSVVVCSNKDAIDLVCGGF